MLDYEAMSEEKSGHINACQHLCQNVDISAGITRSEGIWKDKNPTTKPLEARVCCFNGPAVKLLAQKTPWQRTRKSGSQPQTGLVETSRGECAFFKRTIR